MPCGVYEATDVSLEANLFSRKTFRRIQFFSELNDSRGSIKEFWTGLDWTAGWAGQEPGDRRRHVRYLMIGIQRNISTTQTNLRVIKLKRIFEKLCLHAFN